jgi:hypothetical protein
MIFAKDNQLQIEEKYERNYPFTVITALPLKSIGSAQLDVFPIIHNQMLPKYLKPCTEKLGYMTIMQQNYVKFYGVVTET